MKRLVFSILLVSMFVVSNSIYAQDEAPKSKRVLPSNAQLADQPHNVFKVSIGPAMVFSKSYVGNPSMVYNHRWGFDLMGDLQHIWDWGWGIGFNYAFNHTSFGSEGFSVHYVGPSVVYARRLVGGLGIDASVGLGYGRFVEETHYRVYRSALARNGFGTIMQFGVEYLITDNFGIGIDTNLLTVLTKKNESELPEEEAFGVRRFNILAGLRVYF